MPNDTPIRRWPWLVAVAILMAAALVWRHGSPDSASDSDSAKRKDGKKLSQPVSGGNALPTGARAKLAVVRRNQPQPGIAAPVLAPLPPLNTKVADVLAQLKDAADRGDARAACRVGVELSRCYRAHQFMTMAEKESGEAAKEPNLARQAFMRNGAEELRQDMKPELDMCQGVAATDYNEAWSYLIQSASAGNAEAAGYFYMAPPVSADVDTVELQRIWSEHREEYRDMAIRAGNVHVLNAASVLEGMGIGPYGARVQYPPSLYNALKFATALGPLDARRKPGDENPYLDLFRPKLSEQEFADAQREGEQLRETYFQGIKPVDDPQQSGKPRPERCAGR